MFRCPAGKALIVQLTRSATHRVSSADSIPCSCTARRPTCPAISTTRRGDSSRNTPTVTISWGRRFTMSATAAGAIWRGDGAKMKPTAEAPMPTASRASASEVMPQILTNRPPASSAGYGLTSGRPAGRRRRTVGRPNGRASPPPGRRCIRRRPAGRRRAASRMPDSATATTSVGHASAHPQGAIAVDLEGPQVPLVDADESGADGEGPRSSSASSCTSTSGARSSDPARSISAASSASSRAATISRTASAPMSRASHTSSGDTVKSLRSTGRSQAARAASRSTRATTEERLVGQHGQARCPTGLVLGRHPAGIEVRVEVALGGRAPLDLGDDGHAPGGATRRAGPP